MQLDVGKVKRRTKGSKGRAKFGVRFGKGGFKGKSTVSLEDRKRRLQKLKSQTRCEGCREKGRWANDPPCPRKTAIIPSGNGAFDGDGTARDGGGSPCHGYCIDEDAAEDGWTACVLQLMEQAML